MIKRVVIIGVGLIGSSLGLALQDLKQIEEVIGIDKNNYYLQEALDIGAITEISDLKTGVSQADLVVLATPVGVIIDILENITPYLTKKTIVTDVGSIKSDLVNQVEAIVADQYRYIGGHPMTGSELSGPSGADKYLFENAIYVLTESSNTDAKALKQLKELFSKIGAQVLNLSPQKHDEIVAVTSHLPHLIAVNLMSVINTFEQEDELITSLIAGGFRDTTRIAAGDPIMWRDIFSNNKEQLLKSIDIFQKELAAVKELILEDRQDELTQLLEEVKSSRIKLPMKKKGLLANNFELIVTLADKPNMIGRLATLLGDARINIQDIEILKVRDEGGTIRLSFSKDEEQKLAYSILKAREYKVLKK